MSRCEDFPACGHVGDEGPCPDFDPETGEQLNIKCVCGKSLPIESRFSLCEDCMHDPDCPGCSKCDPLDDDDCFEVDGLEAADAEEYRSDDD